MAYKIFFIVIRDSLSPECNHHHHHHHVVPLARISLALSRHFSLSFITSGRSSGLHPVSSHSCCMYVWAGRPAFAWPYAGVHRSTSLMSSSLLLQLCPACLVRLTCIVFVTGGHHQDVIVMVIYFREKVHYGLYLRQKFNKCVFQYLFNKTW